MAFVCLAYPASHVYMLQHTQHTRWRLPCLQSYPCSFPSQTIPHRRILPTYPWTAWSRRTRRTYHTHRSTPALLSIAAIVYQIQVCLHTCLSCWGSLLIPEVEIPLSSFASDDQASCFILTDTVSVALQSTTERCLVIKSTNSSFSLYCRFAHRFFFAATSITSPEFPEIVCAAAVCWCWHDRGPIRIAVSENRSLKSTLNWVASN